MNDIQKQAPGPTLREYHQPHVRRERATKHSHFTPEQNAELAETVKHMVKANIKVMMASQGMEIVEELRDKLNYLINTYDLHDPSAAEIAEWKDKQCLKKLTHTQ